MKEFIQATVVFQIATSRFTKLKDFVPNRISRLGIYVIIWTLLLAFQSHQYISSK